VDPDRRARFNAAWTPQLVDAVRSDLARRLGGRPPPFPVAETPVFLPPELRDRFAREAEEIVAQLSDPAFIARQSEWIPPQYRMPGRPALPQVAQIDFAVVRAPGGNLAPRLVELQAFPSLYAFQLLLADVWATHLVDLPGFSHPWRLFFGGLDRYQAMSLLRRTLVGGHDPEHVVLLDLRPEKQKTWPDFHATTHWWGIDPVCPTELEREGNRFFRRKDGRRIPIRRFYHRVVMDELEKSGAQIPFRFDEDLDVEWVPHPEWWFVWAKRAMVDLDHPAVPKTTLVSEFDGDPGDLTGHILKPLHSFAGAGVNVDPTAEDLAAVPAHERVHWILQEKLTYADALRSVDGHGVKVELRMMFVRPDGEAEMTLLMNLVRLSRGKMMGVDFNKDLAWTGSSVGIWGP
jgi:hypothetical protein